jgi:hypothetical protein
MRSDLHDLEVYVHVETQPHDPDHGALRVSLDGDEKKAVWLPKSQVTFEKKTFRTGVVTVPERLLYEKGLI